MSSPASRTPPTGGCACGAYQYRLTAQPLFVHVCHCIDCQRRSGSAFGITVIMLASEVELSAAPVHKGTMVSGTGQTKNSYSCAACGSYLYSRPAKRPVCISIRGGTLDPGGLPPPAAHIWVRSKQSWVMLPSGVPAFDTTYDPLVLWPTESLARLERSESTEGHQQ